MKVDLYTRIVLTVIAASLVWICAYGLSPAAAAQDKFPAPTRVLIVDEQNKVVSTANGLQVNVSNRQPLAVELNHVVPVALTAIQRQGTWQPITVDVLKQPPTLMPTP